MLKICVCPSLRDHLLQFKIVHRAYFTPFRLNKISPTNSSEFWRCGYTTGNFTHIYWSFPKIRNYWEEVPSLISLVTSLSIQPSMYVCLLGLVDALASTTAKRTLISLLLLYARKQIAMQWNKPTRPSVSQWCAL